MAASASCHMKRLQQRPLRGLAVLICVAVSVAICRPTSFALPSTRSLHSAEANAIGTQGGLSGKVGQVPTQRPFAGLAGVTGVRPQLPVAKLDGALLAGSEERATDGVSLALAAAGCAVAMRAATASRAEGESAAAPAKEGGLGIFLYIGLWYILNIGYNIYNKKALIAYPYPWACALWQMAFGCLIFMPLWIFKVRKVPKLTVQEAMTLSPSAVGHLATHVGAVIAFFAGAVSFGHIVKASEPVVSSLLNFAFMGEVMRWQVYAALLPIIGGVGIASASEMSFNWLCFGAAMGSNFGSAARAVYSKKVMSSGKIGENMDSSNVYAVLTIMATIMLIPIAFFMEGPTAMLKGFHVAYAKGGTNFLMQMVASGLFYYLYNEVAFLALGKLDPVSHAVCNTMKRVVIIIAAIFIFRTPVTPLGIAGSGVAICGTLLYSLAKNKYK